MLDWYSRMSANSGPAFVPAWTNADVAVTALVAFTIFYLVATMFTVHWPTDLAFLSLVAGGVLVTWPAMVALSMAAVAVAIVVSIAHSIVAPRRSARIAAEADAIAKLAGADFTRDMGGGDRGQRPP
jgi:hypothetical protein